MATGTGAVLRSIEIKRTGGRLAAQDIAEVVREYTAGAVPDYQMAAWLMAVTCRGMDFAETVALTAAYVDSGIRLGLGGGDEFVVDKHSTGGVGDKTTLVVVPVLASLGVPVAKVSGRGLEFAGGTIDKLESIPGLRLSLAPDEMRRVLREAGMVIVEQSADLVPADAATYALRDVTGTVESLPLIAASVMSKKIAVGTDGIVLDVKYGGGALTGTVDDAVRLGRLMIRLGQAFGLRCHAVISDMTAPLGWASGNALEVREAIDALRGVEVPGLTPLCCALAGEALTLAGRVPDRDTARRVVADELRSGRAFGVLRRWIAAQGGDPTCVDDPERLGGSARVDTVTAPVAGWVEAIDARAVGELGLRLGAGRLVKGAAIDRSVGVVLRCRVGDPVRPGQPLADVHWQGGDVDLECAVRAAVRIGPTAAQPTPPVHSVLEPTARTTVRQS